MYACIIALSAMQNSLQARQKLNLLFISTQTTQCMTVYLSNNLWKPFMLFLVMLLYFVALLPPENIQEKNFDGVDFVY